MIPALILPFVFRLGAEKGRVAYVIVIAAATAAAAGVIGACTQDLQLHLQLGAAAEPDFCGSGDRVCLLLAAVHPNLSEAGIIAQSLQAAEAPERRRRRLR